MNLPDFDTQVSRECYAYSRYNTYVNDYTWIISTHEDDIRHHMSAYVKMIKNELQRGTRK